MIQFSKNFINTASRCFGNATMIHESFSGVSRNSSVQPNNPSSHRHCLTRRSSGFATLAAELRFVGRGPWIGPDPDSPGFDVALIRPGSVGGLTWAKAWHEMPHGRVVVAWEREEPWCQV